MDGASGWPQRATVNDANTRFALTPTRHKGPSVSSRRYCTTAHCIVYNTVSLPTNNDRTVKH